MKIFLDDERKAPNTSWLVVRTAAEAIELLRLHAATITHISFDHDLGDGVPTGYDVVCELERLHHEGLISNIWTTVHSANPTGAKRIAQTCERMFGQPWYHYVVDYLALCRFENWRDDERL